MKAYQTVLFIVFLFGGLALMGYIDPDFPSALSMISGSHEQEEAFVEEPEPEEPEPELTPEELIDLRMKELEAARDSEFLAYHQKSPTRISMPDDDPAYLDPFFEALEHANQHPIRVMHYGDSQLEGDRMTGVLREKLQSLFGGNGTGLVPAVQTLGMATAKVTTTPSLEHYMYFGSPEFHASHKGYGPLAQFAHVDSLATFELQAQGGSAYPHCRSFRKVSVAMMGDGEFTVTVGENEFPMTCPLDSTSGGLRIFSCSLPSSVSNATVTARGEMDVYGLMMDGGTGVSVDNIAMRGVSGTLFTSIESRTFAPFFRQQDVRLVILQFGGNSVPYLKGGNSISQFKKSLQSQIAYFHRLVPQACILFIGPSDMATCEEGEEFHTYPCIPQLVDSLRVGAQESGAAFWDMFHAMGGRGSMVKWVEANPQLAGEDYIHFTPNGARHMSQILFGSLELYYNYYRFRHHLDDEDDAFPDSLNL